MKYKLVLIILMLVMISQVSAKIFSENDTYYVEQNLEEEWNFIAGISFEDLHEDSEIVLEEMLSSYFYNAETQEDVEIRPIYQAGDIDALKLYSNAFWVHSLNSGKIIYQVSSSFVDKNSLEGFYQFYAGKNGIAINDEMYGKTINELKSDCTVTSAKFWDASIQNWTDLGLDTKLDFESQDSLTGKGISIEVSENCEFMKEETTSPPSDPGSPGGGGPSGGGGSSGWVTGVINISESQFNLGYTNRFIVGSGIKIMIARREHRVVVDKIMSNSVRVNITSDLQQKTIALGYTAKIEVNDDDYYDLSIKLNSVESNKVSLTIKSINQKISGTTPGSNGGSTPDDGTPSGGEGNEKSFSWIFWAIITIIIIVIIIIIFLIIKKRNKKNDFNALATPSSVQPRQRPTPPSPVSVQQIQKPLLKKNMKASFNKPSSQPL